MFGTVDTGKGWNSQVCSRAIVGITTCHKMRHSMSLPTVTCICISYLSNRKQYVDFLNNRSAYASLNVGVPQGSILGPLLFIIYVNDITASSNIFKFLMYADDTTLFTTINCFENNENTNQYINDELSKINEWLIVNKLSLNASKIKFMVFSMPQKKV